MKDKIQDQINRYKNELNDHKKMLELFKTRKVESEATTDFHRTDYWINEIRSKKDIINEIEGFLNSLDDLLNECE